MSEETLGNYETQQAIRAMELQGHDPLVDEATFNKIVGALDPKDKTQMTPKQKLIEAVTQRRESAIDASIKFRAMADKRDAYIISNARANLYDEFLELIEEILPNE